MSNLLLLRSELPGQGDQGGWRLCRDHLRTLHRLRKLPELSQKAKVVIDRMVKTTELLASGDPVVAVLGCSFPFFHAYTPGQLVAGLKSLGFHEVHEGAYGVRMIAPYYAEQIGTTDHT